MLFRKPKRTVWIKLLSFQLLHKWMEYNISEIKMSIEPIHLSVKHFNLPAEPLLTESFPPGRCTSRHQEKGFGPLFRRKKYNELRNSSQTHTFHQKAVKTRSHACSLQKLLTVFPYLCLLPSILWGNEEVQEGYSFPDKPGSSPSPHSLRVLRLPGQKGCTANEGWTPRLALSWSSCSKLQH